MSNTINRRVLAIAIAMRAHFCNIESDDEGVAAFERLGQLAQDDVDADPSACGLPVWDSLEGEGAAAVFDNVEGLANEILATWPAAPVVLVEVSGGNVQGVSTQGEADVYIIDYDNGAQGTPEEHADIPDKDGDTHKASVWNAGGVDTADPDWIAKVLAVIDPAPALAAVIETFGHQAWSATNGPTTGRGEEYWFVNGDEDKLAYVCIDGGEVVSCTLDDVLVEHDMDEEEAEVADAA